MYDFAKRPLWVLSHVLVLVAVLAMVRLGFWQMSRWHEEQDNAERIEAGMDAAAVPLEDLLVELGDPEVTDDVGAEAEYRRVVARGTRSSHMNTRLVARVGSAPGQRST